MEDSDFILLPKALVKETPNDQVLGSLVREIANDQD